MKKSFWDNLPRPFFCLAPMANVTDAAFRKMFVKYGDLSKRNDRKGGPDVFWTEFVSADGLFRGNFDVLSKDFLFSSEERPIVAQIFSSDIELMKRASALVAKLGFDGVDINMGCPDKGVCRQGAGAALIKNPKVAREIIRVTKEVSNGLPVSVKTRIGYAEDELDIWLPELLAEEPAAITLHARTKKELSKVPANWDAIEKAVDIRNRLNSKTLIIGNGDVRSIEEAKIRAKESGADGVMIGRGLFGNPWFFTGYSPTPTERIQALSEHIGYFEKLLGDIKNFANMKKHFKSYVEGFSGARELRVQLMETKNAREALAVLGKAITQYSNEQA
ncbi:MAG: tRNA-dihydrouridine synthase [Patescibacteria group bacterium]